jgi:hypothetical protein
LMTVRGFYTPKGSYSSQWGCFDALVFADYFFWFIKK